MNHYPVLYFMIACNHIYPIEDKRTQLSISNINKKGGRAYNKIPKQHTYTNIKMCVFYMS